MGILRWKSIEVAGVVVMQVRHDHVLDGVGRHAEPGQRIHRIERQLRAAQRRLFGIEAVSTRMSRPARSDQPDEIVESCAAVSCGSAPGSSDEGAATSSH